LSTPRLELKPSPALAALILALHAAAGLSVLLVVPTAAGLLLAGGLLALGAAAAWSRALLRSKVSPLALEIAGEEVVLHLAGGARFPVEVAARRYVTRFMVALPIRRPVRRTILVTRGMLDGDSFRALRVWALWGKLPASAAMPSGAGQSPWRRSNFRPR
jgi:hypothetical protein